VLPFARIKVKLVARRDAAPTTHCQIGLRFSAVQPPSELIPKDPSTQSSYYTSQSSICSLAGETIWQSKTFCTYILLITTEESKSTIRTYLSAATLETKPTTTPNEAHGLRLHHLL
jgi:hypothetical protein